MPRPRRGLENSIRGDGPTTISHWALRPGRRAPLYVLRNVDDTRDIMIGIGSRWGRYRFEPSSRLWMYNTGDNLNTIFTEDYLARNQTMITRAEYDRMRGNESVSYASLGNTVIATDDSLPIRMGVDLGPGPAITTTNRPISGIGPGQIIRGEPARIYNWDPPVHPIYGENAIETRVYCNKCPVVYSLHINSKCPECESIEYKLRPDSKEIFMNKSRSSDTSSARFTHSPTPRGAITPDIEAIRGAWTHGLTINQTPRPNIGMGDLNNLTASTGAA